MGDFNEFDERDLEKIKSLERREYYYEQKRKLFTVWNLNYEPSSDSRIDKVELTGSQVQLTFDMGYRLAMAQIKQYLQKDMTGQESQSLDNLLTRVAKFTEERIEDSFCLHYFPKQYDELVKHKQAYELDAKRSWIECSEYE